jgi:hypothetical protein
MDNSTIEFLLLQASDGIHHWTPPKGAGTDGWFFGGWKCQAWLRNPPCQASYKACFSVPVQQEEVAEAGALNPFS